MESTLNAYNIYVGHNGQCHQYFRRIPNGCLSDAMREGSAAAKRAELADFTVSAEEAKIRQFAVDFYTGDGDERKRYNYFAYNADHLHLKVIATARVQYQMVPEDVQYHYMDVTPDEE